MRCNQQRPCSITSQKLKGQLKMDSCNLIADLHRDFRQTSTHKINMASQRIQIACIDCWQLQMVRALINLIQFRIQSVSVELRSLSLHIALDRPDFVI